MRHDRVSCGLLTAAIGLLLAASSGSANAATLPNGGSISDAISVSGEQDLHDFTASAGDHVVLRIVDINGGQLYPRIELSGPSGFIEARSEPTVGTIEIDATETGTFTVLVRDDSVSGPNDPATGPYELYFVRIPGAAELGALANDSRTLQTIDVGDLDTYTLAASAGDHLVLRIADTAGGALYPRIELYAPDGSLAGSGEGPLVGTVEHDAAQSGTYTLLVKDNSVSGGGDSGTGAYDLYVTRIPGADELGLLLDEVDEEETIALGDLDTFVFDSLAGANLSITIEDLSGTSFYPRAELYRPDGTLASAATGEVSGSLAYLTAEAGTFTVLVKDDSVTGGGDSGAGDYRLSFDTDMPFVSPIPALSPTGAAALGLLVVLAGRRVLRRRARTRAAGPGVRRPLPDRGGSRPAGSRPPG